MKSTSLLRTYIRQLLRESSGDYSSLAAVVRDAGSMKRVVVYDPEVIRAAVERGINPLSLEGAEDLGLRGYILIEHAPGWLGLCSDAWEVQNSWVRNKGDGRLVYGLAFALAPNGTLIPDRTSVSDAAASGWLRAGTKSENPLTSTPLDDIKHKKCGPDGLNSHTEDESDDCRVYGIPHLDRTYQNPEREMYVSLLGSLEINHEATMRDVSGGDQATIGDLEMAIETAGQDAFTASM